MNRVESIVKYIASGATSLQRVGLELEHFIYNDEYEMISYEEMAQCLEEICEKAGGQAFRQDGQIFGIFCMDYNISIEPSCQLEISIYPKESPQEIMDSYEQFRAVCEPIFVSRGYRLSESGVFPLVENGKLSPDNLPLIPKDRYRRMDEHFKGTGAHGRYMMRATASTQVCIDFSSEEDAMKKLRVLEKLAPILSLIAENKSGIGSGKEWKKHLLRNQIWRDVDPVRCGYLNGSVSTGYSFEEYARYLEAHADIQFRAAKEDVSATDLQESVSSEDISMADIEHLISVYFPMVRLKRYLEFRAADSMPVERAIGFAMLVKRLMYTEDVLDALDERLAHVESVDEILAAEDVIFDQGFHAVVYGKHIMEWMKELFAAALGCASQDDNETEQEYIKKAIPLPLLNYEYKELVVGKEDQHRASALGIREYLMQSTAKYHGRVVRTLYFPKLFTPREIAVFDRAVKELYGIFDKVYAEFERNESYRRLFGFSPELTELILREKKYNCNIPIARIDIFYDEETGDFKFCEFNTDGTSAMNEDRELNIAFSKTQAYQEFAKAHRLSSFELFDTWVDEVLKLYEEFATYNEAGAEPFVSGLADLPKVAIVDFMESATENEFKIFVDRFKKRGCKAEICDIRDVRWDGSKCTTSSGMEVDVIYRRAVTSDILSHMDEVSDFIAVAKSGRVCLLGDFRTQIAHNKVLYKILHMEQTMKLLTRREQEFVRAHVPYTISLDEAFAAGNEEFFAGVQADKDGWIIKPEDSYGSRGVHAGVEHESIEEWARLLSENRNKKYILQEFNNPYELLNVDFSEEGYRWVNASNLTGLFVYNGELRGAYSRISFVKMISTQYSEMSSPTVLVE